jgi:uncharacterized protein (TIGR03437 family)
MDSLMGRMATVRWGIAAAFAAALCLPQPVWAQAPAAVSADWRHIGTTVIDRDLAGLATGPVERVWYSPDGSRVFIHTASGRNWETDLETWKLSGQNAADPVSRYSPPRLPEAGARVRTPMGQSFGNIYAFGQFAWRSGDGGTSWDNLTGFRDSSLLGGGLADLAVSPRNEEEIVVAGANGVFRSADGGKSWSGLNQGLANLPAVRLLSVPAGDRALQLGLPDGQSIEWQPGEKRAWRPASNSEYAAELLARRDLSANRGGLVTALTVSGDATYIAMADGRMFVSLNRGLTSTPSVVTDAGSIDRIWVDPEDPRIAVAVLGARKREQAFPTTATHVLRTVNGGAFWDDLTGNLPEAGVHSVAVDRSSGAIYIATDRGVFFTHVDLATRGNSAPWTAVPGLPPAPALDVKLDTGGNQLWALVDGFGVYATLAPHRLRDPRVVSAADYVARAIAPGALVSVLGARVDTAQAGDLQIPVLDSNAGESQLQIPFEASGSSLSLSLQTGSVRRVLGPLTLNAASPAIFVMDGTPMLLDADSSVMLDSVTPAHAGTRVQILATGLGRVKPDWPTGLAAPLENPPQVAGNVHVYLDHSPIEVTRAVLAPGYVGFYLVEAILPKVVNYGVAELNLEVDGQASNRVRLFIGPQ